MERLRLSYQICKGKSHMYGQMCSNIFKELYKFVVQQHEDVIGKLKHGRILEVTNPII